MAVEKPELKPDKTLRVGMVVSRETMDTFKQLCDQHGGLSQSKLFEAIILYGDRAAIGAAVDEFKTHYKDVRGSKTALLNKLRNMSVDDLARLLESAESTKRTTQQAA